GHDPSSARPDIPAEPARKFVRRNQLAVSLSAAGLLAVVAGVIGTAIQARTARRERDFATNQLARAQAINDFNSIVLTDAAPWGKPVTIGDLLARAEQLIDSRADMDSTKRAELLMSVASQYGWHEQYGTYRRLMEQAARLARTSPDPSTRARASCALGEAIGLTDNDFSTAESLIQAGLHEIPDARFALDRVDCLQDGTYVAL